MTVYNEINCNSYETARSSIGRAADLYEKTVEKKYLNQGYPFVEQGCKDFWAKQLGIIVEGYYGKGDRSLISLANGAYLYAMQRFSKILNTEDVNKIQKELEDSMVVNSIFDNLSGVRKFFPVLQEGYFTVNPNGGTGESAWWQQYAPDHLPDRFRALYLPLRAESSQIISGEDQTFTNKMDYVLVPFNMMTDKTPVQGRPLKEIPINPFYMATAETTVEQMQAYWSATGQPNGCPAGTEASKPYADASPAKAIAFCNWLSEQDGLEPLYEPKEDGWNLDLRKPGYRLPFDFEWEYAARFGYDFFPKSGESNWEAMKQELAKKVENQLSNEDINSGLVNYYDLTSLRMPKEGSEYPLGMYDLCGNASEICMTVEDLSKELEEEVEVGFVQMDGGEYISSLEVVAPWLSDEVSNGVSITDKDKGCGFRVIRTVPICLFE